MAKWKCVVATVTPYLRRRTSPGLKSNNISSKKLYSGDTYMSSECKLENDIMWYKDDATGLWSASTEQSGKVLMKITSLEPTDKDVPATNNTSVADSNISNSNRVQGSASVTNNATTQTSNGVMSSRNVSPVSDTGNMNTVRTSSIKGYDIVNSMNFPVNKGTSSNPSYDYTTNVNSIRTDSSGTMGEELIQEIRENLNIFSGWTKLAINNKYHTEFNRFKLDHPDIFLRNTVGYIVFTRPDLNFLDDSGQLLSGISVDPRVEYIARNNIHLVQCLTHEYDGTTGHNFNPFLSNLAQSIEVMDDSVDTLDTGETFTGYKFQYSKHNIKSITSGSLTIKFKETFDLGITNLFQLWVDYQSNVYKGVFLPKDDYIWFKNIDYMCNIYYFLLDQDGETLLFWSKYFGVFPVNVPKSSLAYDAGSQVQLPDMSVQFSYIYKEDLSPATLVEFNRDAGLEDSSNVTYLPTYNAQLGHSGKTWAGVPFVSSFETNNGINATSHGFKFRFRSPRDINNSRSYGQSDAANVPARTTQTMNQTELSDRALVQKVAGLQNNTMDYLDKWGWSSELYRKAANAIRNQTAAGSTANSADIVQTATGFQDETMAYLNNWDWGDELMRKLANAMKNGV